ncbi:hypothetical protein D3C76_1869140 [compost metagenome]
MKADDVFFAVAGEAGGFQGAGTNRVDGGKGVALVEQVVPFAQRAFAFDDLVQRADVLAVERQRQAQGG